jgi:hypothetical protein
MTSLADLDELILRCRDDRAKAYIQEAVASYRAGAFRAAVVATWIAVCFDVIEKLHELALAGDKEAEHQVTELEKIRKSGDLVQALRFERDLLVLIRDKFELISPLEYIDLERLQADRNRCAHPSIVSDGQPYSPSAELARLHIRTAITSVLQHPPAQGKFALDRLVQDVSSDYFPANVKDATAFLSSGPLRKARESLVRNFLVILGKSYFADNKKSSRRLVAAIVAAATLHPTVYRATFTEKLSPIFRHIPDDQLGRALFFLHDFSDSWQFLETDMQQRMSNYVSAIPRESFSHIQFALDITALVPFAEERIRRATREDLQDQLYFTLPRQIGDRFIDLYLESKSYEQANTWAKELMSNAGEFSDSHIRRLIENIAANGELTGSFELGALINSLRKNGKLPPGEFEHLLQKNGLGDYAEGAKETESDFTF